MNEAIAQLVRDLDNEDPHVRFAAARTLGEVGGNDRAACNALIRTLKDTTWFVRLAVVQSIRDLKVNPDLIFENIVPMLKDDHEDIREYAALTI